MSLDLSSLSYFDVEKGSRIELFINGDSRLFTCPQGDCRVYFLFEPTVPSDDDSLPF